jgi:hypothetical protein
LPEPITPYELPEPANRQLLALAAEGDLLLIGETHGTIVLPTQYVIDREGKIVRGIFGYGPPTAEQFQAALDTARGVA